MYIAGAEHEARHRAKVHSQLRVSLTSVVVSFTDHSWRRARAAPFCASTRSSTYVRPLTHVYSFQLVD